MSLRTAVHQKWMAIAAPYKKVPHASTLLKDGKITPEEFVVAGDSLIAVCPTWSWCSAEDDKRLSFLPPDKQYLINRRVVCPSRASAFKDVMEKETDCPDFEGWVQAGETTVEEAVDLESDEEPVDLDTLDLDNIDLDEPEETNSDERMYDITIVYDRYYNVPHVFLNGVSATGKQLTPEEMYQDISAEHAERTVTYESNHPFFSGKYLSIHPCQHHNVILRMAERMEHPENFCAPAYFFMFLKFIHTVVPTIDVSTPELEISGDY